MRLFRPALLLFSLLAVTFVGCDSGEEEPVVEEVILVGTNVPSDFLMTGRFGLVATPLDEGGGGILSTGVAPEVVIETVNGEAVDDILAQSEVDGVNDPSDNSLAVAISIDNSGSMAGNDPDRIRVDGAIAFVETLENAGADYEAGVFMFGPSAFTPPFQFTTLLQSYTDEPDSLVTAINMVGANAGTPTYGSLIEVMEYSEDERPTASYERAVVLLSDGQPGDTFLRDDACQLADSLDSPVYAIGLGPASDISPNQQQGAVDEMREIAQCSGGAYAGIAEGDVSSITQIYSSIGTATVEGSLTIGVQLENFENLEVGDIVGGVLRLASGGSEAEADFQFRVRSAAGARVVPDGIGITD